MKRENKQDATTRQSGLVLRLETVRILSPQQLSLVVGGVEDGAVGCTFRTTDTEVPVPEDHP